MDDYEVPTLGRGVPTVLGPGGLGDLGRYPYLLHSALSLVPAPTRLPWEGDPIPPPQVWSDHGKEFGRYPLSTLGRTWDR